MLAPDISTEFRLGRAQKLRMRSSTWRTGDGRGPHGLAAPPTDE